MPYTTYIIYSSKIDRYYIGSCEDIISRLRIHNQGRNKSTKKGVPWELKYTEKYNTRSEAQSREMLIKRKKSRIYIQSLIRSVG